MSAMRSLTALVGALAITVLTAAPALAAAVPGPPTGVSALPGNAAVTVSWTAPASSGDSPIVSYSVTANPGNHKAHVGAARRSATVTGLTNGTQYTLTVHATNDAGNSAESAPVTATPVAPSGVPGAPTGVTATAGDTTATVSWTAPASTGATAITSYVVTASPGGRTATVAGSARQATVTGLTNGTAHTFTVRAVNSHGTGPASAPSAAVTPAGVPGAPTNLRLTPGDRRVTVTWTAANANGSPITSSTVTASPGGRTATVSGAGTSATVTGLTNGTSYTFTVRSTNARGTGPASGTSSAVRPGATDAVRRLAGASRIGTAIALSQDRWTGGEATAVVLTRSDGFADALAGAPLASAKGGPLLLTPPSALDAAVRTEIRRVLPAGRTVYVLGGTSAISSAIVSLLRSDGYAVVRYAGADRFATAVEIADRGLGNPETQLLVTGLDFPDALAAGAAAAEIGGAVLLTKGRTLEASTREYLADHPGTRYAIGGHAVDAHPAGISVAGADRYDTAVRVAQRFFSGHRDVGVASGLVFADALPGSVHVADAGGPMLLVGSTMPAVTRGYLESVRASVTTAHVYGGAGAVPEPVLDAVRSAIV